jgi:hypothetical protein
MLSWTASPNPNVVRYRVYYGTAPRAYNQAMGQGVSASGSTHTITGLQVGQNYHFAVTSVDASGKESSFSNEATKTIQ